MIFQYASDFHLEFAANSRYMREHPLEPRGDVLLLAGDIIYLENRRMEADPFFDWCADNFRETVIVPGNHEYYYDPEDVAGRTGVPVERTLAGYEHRIRDNVRYLNNRSAVFGDVEVFATTLWIRTDPRYYVTIQNGMNDCWAILYDGHAMWAGLYSAFYVDMEPLIERHDIACWVYGHTHTQCGSGTVIPSMGGATALLCNQLGYVGTGEHLNGFAGDRHFEL